MTHHRFIVVALALAGVAFAQDGQTQAKQKVGGGRGAAPARPATENQSASQTLQGGPAPKPAQGQADVPLTPNAEEAVRVSEQWMASKNAPAAGPDGKVVFSYGAGLPTVVCAPLRVCIIELQSGEKIIGEPQIGDSVRWNLAPALFGKGDEATSVIVLKPQSAGLDTNLLITTDRRAYYLRLISKPEDYVARAAFAYPDGDERKWQVHLAQQQAEAKEANRNRELTPAAVAVGNLCFDYAVKGGDENLRPVRVFDDGAKTYIQMPPGVQNRQAPALVVIGQDGKGEMVNYRVKDQLYIVDRLFDRAQLILGAGKKAQKVEITRERK
ncbi:MAG: P-type conjugative transfer protein TrbG [Bryobacteraceae bacterium]